MSFKSSRTRALAGLFAALAVLVTPALLFAHARLLRATPAIDGRVSSPPTALSLWFSERPELRFTSLQLVDSAGVAVSLGTVASVADDPMGVTAPITGSMTAGRYSVIWRTAAADGHASNGKFFFVVSAPPISAVVPPVEHDTGALSPALSPKPIPNAVVGPPQFAGFSTALRWAELIAVVTLVGAMVFRLFVLHDARLSPEVTADAVDRTKRLANAVLFLFAITTLWRLSAEADLIPTAGTARFAAMVSVARDTMWGHGWLVGGVGVVIAALGLLIAATSFTGWIVAALGVVAICVAEALTGHAAASVHRAALATAVDVAHVLSAGGWLGGLATVLMCGLPATGRVDSNNRRQAGHQLVRAYHRAAIQCVTLLIITAALGAWMRLDTPSDLWTSGYGRILIGKMMLLGVLIGFGFFHWKTIIAPEWGDDTRFRFQRSATAELVVGAIVIGLTAVLVITALPHA